MYIKDEYLNIIYYLKSNTNSKFYFKINQIIYLINLQYLHIGPHRTKICNLIPKFLGIFSGLSFPSEETKLEAEQREEIDLQASGECR